MKKLKKKDFHKKIIKKFSFDCEHTIECQRRSLIGPYDVFLDGKKLGYNEAQEKEWFGYFRTTVVISGTFLEIVVSMDKIYVLKDGVDIETGIVSEPLVIPYWYKRAGNAIGFLPPALLVMALYSNNTLKSNDDALAFGLMICIALIIGLASIWLGRVFIFHPLKTSKNRVRYSLISLILGAVIGMCSVMLVWLLM